MCMPLSPGATRHRSCRHPWRQLPRLLPDAVDELLVGVRERFDAFALQRGGDPFQITPLREDHAGQVVGSVFGVDRRDLRVP